MRTFDYSQFKKALFIYPHPDDETYCNYKLISDLVALKIPVRVVVLTKGESSTLRFGLKNGENLAYARELEFTKVMTILRVSDFTITNFADGKLAKTLNIEDFIENEVTNYLPSHVITYEPDGMYGHPDHMCVSSVVAKFQKSRGFNLIYSTVPKSYKMSASSLNMPNNKESVRPIDYNIVLSLSFVEFLKKIQTLFAYKTQFSIWHEPFYKILMILTLFKEYYHHV